MTRVLIRNIKRQDYLRTTRLWGRCPSCGSTWQWSGHTASAEDGEVWIQESRCMCDWPLTPDRRPFVPPTPETPAERVQGEAGKVAE